MATLAINGGSPLRTEAFPSWPVYDDTEIQNVVDVIKSGKWWRFAYGEGVELRERTSGDDRAQTVLFQEAFAKLHDARYGLACATGTAALELVLKAMGIGPGDEVIVPSYTYVGSATCVLQINAIPVFCDILPDTYNMDPKRFEEAITPRTKAVIPVHFAGQPADMDEIMSIAHKHGLYVLEDCAHAHGARWQLQSVGTLGHAGAFSFQASKNMTSGEGGAVVTNDHALAKKCDSYLWAGREVGRPWYEFHRLGWNYRLSEFQGALLLAQIKRLLPQIETRAKNVGHLKERLQEFEGLQLLTTDKRVDRHSHHIVIVKYDASVWGIHKNKMMDALTAEGIEVFKGYDFPLYKNPMFINGDFYPKGCPVHCPHYGTTIDYAAFEKTNPVAEKACSSEAVWLDQRMFLGTTKDVDDIVDALNKIRKNIGELKR